MAALMAETFYTEVANGRTIGAAAQIARRRVHESAPSNPTWLAYSVYGHPNALVVLPPQSPTSTKGAQA
jgi:hypothetical protein